MAEVPFEEQLARALAREPKTYDSKGKAYYVGPTVGQVVSGWFMEHAGAFDKIADYLRRGIHHAPALKMCRKEWPDLTTHHLEYVQRHMDR